MIAFDTPLPVDAILGDLTASLREKPNAVLVAPPGAGKTTRVPLALLDEPWAEAKKIILLEPRRLAARGAAERMARTLGEQVGETVGLRVRLGSKIGRKTRIEVVTEGVFTRMILDDPELSGVAAVLFDEFHERSLDADLGLAFAVDAQGALREDLRLLVMSATLDGARVASLLGEAPVIASEGRAFPVETRYLGRDPNRRIEEQVADAVLRALKADTGSILVFLPGQGEILRVNRMLEERITDASVLLAPLYGALDQRDQDRAVMPAPTGNRKIVLATAIAETSLTIEGVRVVVDSGLSRVPRYEPDIGLTRLETVRVSRASADQRRGRAGRTQSGICYRLWEEAGNGALKSFSEPEILSADLSPLLLDCAAWGVSDPATLAFLDKLPAPALQEGRVLLEDLGALDGEGRLTERGRHMRALPLPPRLARMVIDAAVLGAAREAAEIAAVLVERGLGGDGVDLAHRLDRFGTDRSRRAEEMRRLARNWADLAMREMRGPIPGMPALSPAAILTLAYPDRIAKARGGQGAFLMANGRGASLPETEALARAPFLAIAEMSGGAANARILLAASLAPAELDSVAGDRIDEREEVRFDRASRSLRARRLRKLDAIVLDERPLPVPQSLEAATVLAEGLANLGLDTLPWSKAQAQTRHRVAFLRQAYANGDARADQNSWPDLGDEVLAGTAADWLAPHLIGKAGLSSIGADDLAAALDVLLPWDLKRRLEAEAPTHFEAPTGSRVPIDYDAQAGPVLAIRVQELFGLKSHPTVAAGKLPLVLHLLSPAQRPIQITKDLPGFWAGSWSGVKSDLKGRYPRHPWPEDPANAAPTTRAKPRGT